jgi:hypothetical protein
LIRQQLAHVLQSAVRKTMAKLFKSTTSLEVDEKVGRRRRVARGGKYPWLATLPE